MTAIKVIAIAAFKSSCVSIGIATNDIIRKTNEIIAAT